MKKYFFSIAIIALFGFSCRAQDTVQYGDPYYWFNTRQYFEQRTGTFLPWTQMCCWHGFIDSDYVYRYHTGEELVVYGVAITADTHNLSIDKYNFELNLAQLRHDSLIFIDSTTWKPNDKRAHFTYSIPGDGQIYEQTVPCFELYFDTPRIVYDTFFVGFREVLNGDFSHYLTLFFSYDSANTYIINNAHNNISNCSSHIDSTMNGYDLEFWGTLFPIVQYRYPCETPAAPRPIVYAATNPNLVQFQLPYSAGDSMWLSIAEYGQPADSGIIYNVTDSVMDIVVPDSGYYTARLRSFCTKYWDVPIQSAWSAPANFMITSNLGIVRPDLQQPGSIVVTPNPTRGTVHIEADGVRAVWLVAADGRRTQLPCKDGTVSLKAFAPGLYVLEVQTADGVYKAKVVKE